MSSVSGAQFEADLPAETPVAGSETALLLKARSGDRTAYGQIVLRYQDRLYNAVLRLVGDHDEARELTQEALLRALEKIETFRGDSSPYTWLFRIAMNLAISQLRKEKRHRVFSLDAAAQGGHRSDDPQDQASSLLHRTASAAADAPGARLDQQERCQQVLAAMGRLDPDTRALLVMRDVEEMDYQQMADILGLPLGTLKSRLFRARLALRDQLQEYMSPA
jgi:RNA polymerase sigma-70 factor (ECF subfamily)